MAGTRLVATPFPYASVRAGVLALPHVEAAPLELNQMIETGKRLGWSKEQLDGYEALRAGGRCLSFRQNQPPWLRGTLWEDNVFFEYADENEEAAMRPEIAALARRLGLTLLEY